MVDIHFFNFLDDHLVVLHLFIVLHLMDYRVQFPFYRRKVFIFLTRTSSCTHSLVESRVPRVNLMGYDWPYCLWEKMRALER